MIEYELVKATARLPEDDDDAEKSLKLRLDDYFHMHGYNNAADYTMDELKAQLPAEAQDDVGGWLMEEMEYIQSMMDRVYPERRDPGDPYYHQNVTRGESKNDKIDEMLNQREWKTFASERLRGGKVRQNPKRAYFTPEWADEGEIPEGPFQQLPDPEENWDQQQDRQFNLFEQVLGPGSQKDERALHEAKKKAFGDDVTVNFPENENLRFYHPDIKNSLNSFKDWLKKENGDDESSWSPDDLRNPYEEHKFDQSLYQQTGMDRLEAVQAGLCAKCTGKSGNYETGEGFTDDASRREYGITGYCQQCQDDFYGSLPPDEPMEKFYKAYVLNKRINIKDQQRGAPGLGIHQQDIDARRASAKRLQQEKFRSDEDANRSMDMARDIKSGNFITVDPNDTTKVIPNKTAFPKESYVPKAKKWGEQLVETENQHIRSSRDQGPDVMIADPNFKPKPTDTMSKPSLSSQAWRHRDMQNRPEDRVAYARDQKNTFPNEKGRHMKWESTSDLVNTALGRPKGTPTVQQGQMNIAPTGYKPQTETPLKGAQWKGTANKKAAASTYTPGIKSASQLET